MSSLRKRVGDYYVGRTLGEGTYAKVKYGQHVRTGEAVAIKVLDKKRLHEAGMEDQIKREIHILTNLHHPHIVDLKEVMASGESVFMVMELVPGGELFDQILLEGAVKEERAKEIFGQLMDGLEYCHLHRIYHRDLKPENVLLTSDGQVKLSDFGLGALPSSQRENGLLATTCGTPNYVAPEVLARKGYAGGPADIWSLGVLLYVIACGKLPFEEQHIFTLFHNISRANYKKPPWLSDHLLSLLDLMLQPDPNRRATFDQLRAHPWTKGGLQQKQRARPLASLPALDDIFQTTVIPQRLTKEELMAAQKGLAGSIRKPAGMNAFELMNSALDISAIFERRDDVVSRATRFTSRAHPADILRRLESSIAKLGGSAKRRDSARVKLIAGRSREVAAANVELIPVLPGVHMVEFAKSSGSSLAFHELFRAVLNDCRTIIAQ